MASDVIIHCRPGEPLALPAVCCYCLAPATTSRPVRVWRRKVRISRHVRARRPFAIAVPYCAAHAEDAGRFRRLDRVAAVILGAVAIALLVAFDLTLGQGLRALNGALWWCSTVLVMAMLGFGVVVAYELGRRLIQQRRPAAAGHVFNSGLGVETNTQRAYQAPDGSGLMLVERFTFHNPAYAEQVAALHSVEARRGA